MTDFKRPIPNRQNELLRKNLSAPAYDLPSMAEKSKEGSDAWVQAYNSTAPSTYPEAEQILQIRVDDTTIIGVSLYENNEAMERASAARSQSFDSVQDNIVSVDMKIGTVELNHS